ncbi:MAG: zonular occludens toxin domain-containing protein [Synechococcus sp.]|jgi:hypothetical protein|tara:strand:+ start:524 stop:1564 length:1041 start_codon:yes stop_codon:yes gene_type:complete
MLKPLTKLDKFKLPDTNLYGKTYGTKSPGVQLYEEEDSSIKAPGDFYAKKNFQPIVTFFFGRRGQGKTLAMTTLAYMMAERYKKAGLHNHQVLTNYATSFSTFTPYLIDEMIQFPAWLKDGAVCIDEVQSAFPSARAMSSINVLFTNMLTQLRKRKLEISFTTQFPQMISYGVLTQVDLFVLCEKVAGGRAIKLYIFDHWGQWTGKTWKKNFPQPKSEADQIITLHNTDKMWGAYNTEEVVASFQSEHREQIIEDQYDFSANEPEIEKPTAQDPIQKLIQIVGMTENKIDPYGILNQVKEMVQKDESGELEQYAEITKIYDLKPYFEKEGYGFVRQGGKTWGVKND